MYSMWLTDEEQRTWRAYLEMASRLQTAMHRQLQHDCELSLADYDVLVALSDRGPQRVNELGEVLAWEQSRLSHQLRRMRGRGLVDRRGSGDDRRGVTVELTDTGRAALEAAAPGHVELVRSVMFDGLSAAQLRTFGSVIDSVRARLTSLPR
jgi:DNA-binding MarR family transcriptional regulator